MKRIKLLLALCLLFGTSTVINADDTILTTTVPASEYTLNIPANQSVEYGVSSAEIGNVTVTNSSGFAYGKNLVVSVSHDEFTSEDVHTTIPYILYKEFTYNSGLTSSASLSGSENKLIFAGTNDGNVEEQATFKFESTSGDYTAWVKGLRIGVLQKDWGKALAGDYSTTITFTSEVTVE